MSTKKFSFSDLEIAVYEYNLSEGRCKICDFDKYFLSISQCPKRVIARKSTLESTSSPAKSPCNEDDMMTDVHNHAHYHDEEDSDQLDYCFAPSASSENFHSLPMTKSQQHLQQDLMLVEETLEEDMETVYDSTSNEDESSGFSTMDHSPEPDPLILQLTRLQITRLPL